MGEVIDLRQRRVEKDPVGAMNADDLADNTIKLDNLRLALMDALFDIKDAVGDGENLPIRDELLALRDAIETAMDTASRVADVCEDELMKRAAAL